MIELSHPLVQAKLLVVEKEVVVKQLPKMSYRDLEGLFKELAGPQGCKHVIVNIGLVNGKWEGVEAIVCDAKVITSSVEIGSYSPSEEVERIIAEVYEFPKDVISELERYSMIEVPKSVVEESVKAYEQPPLLKTVEEAAAPKYPTDLLPRVEGDLGELKDISHVVVSVLEAESIDKYTVIDAIEEGKGKVVIVVMGPEYVPKITVIANNLAEMLRDYDVKEVVVRSGVKTVKKSIQ